jgi:hypothetical protein
MQETKEEVKQRPVINEIITVTWWDDDGNYKVSVPNWNGGQVITLEAHKAVVAEFKESYDNQCRRIEELEKASRDLLQKLAGTGILYDERLELINALNSKAN